MNVEYEFLSETPIENVITCLNFRFDKVVCFGYTDTVKRMKKMTKEFLQTDCGVAEVLFVQIKQYDLQGIAEQIRTQVREDRKAGSKIFFDATGGASLLQIAFGMLSAELRIPIHNYDVAKGKLHLLQPLSGGTLPETVQPGKVKLNLDLMIRMHGGRIAPRRKKKDFPTTDIREIEDESFRAMIPKLWSVVKANREAWPQFSAFLKKTGTAANLLRYEMPTETALGFIRGIQETHPSFTPKLLKSIMEYCSEQGVFSEYRWSANKSKLSFTYASSAVKKCMIDTGSILELHAGEEESRQTDDCRVGVRIDWDGVLHDNPDKDVENEIDVLSLKGYILCFTSCKIGRVGRDALYELATVANRFGGEYTKKRLVIARDLTETERLRAEEMGIEVVKA